MRGFDAVFSAARLLARTTSLSISAAAKGLALKAEVAVGFFLRIVFAADQASVTDDQSLGVTKPLGEASSLVDDDVITLLKKATELGALTDDDVLTIVKGLTETPAVAEAHIFALTKPLTDSSGVADVPSMQPTKALTDAHSASDDDTIDFTKFAGVDLASFADNNLFSISKFLNDQTFVTDDLDGEASTEDDQEIAFVKTRTDIGAASDTFHRAAGYLRAFTENGATTDSQVKLTTKVSSDSAAFTDAGDLRSQGYCDFTYFAEDYVGASRIFT